MVGDKAEIVGIGSEMDMEGGGGAVGGPTRQKQQQVESSLNTKCFVSWNSQYMRIHVYLLLIILK